MSAVRKQIVNKFRVLSVAAILLGFISVSAQIIQPPQFPSYKKYLDNISGMTVDEIVAHALEHNAELIGMRKEEAAGEALIRQARLRPNPSITVSGAREIGGMGDNSLMVQGDLPLELGGRRSARIRIAEHEHMIHGQATAEMERRIAGEARTKFGEALAAALKLKFTEEMLTVATENFELVAAQVNEGRRPPLERNMEAVELNRIRALREITEGSVEMRMLELRNLAGMSPEEPLLIRGDFEGLLGSAPPENIATDQALQRRPDLGGARAVEMLAEARIEQARAEGRFDADVMLGYQRMRTGFPLLGVEASTGALLPIESKLNYFTFGVKLNLPLRNRNQGTIAAAKLEAEAARSRREFGELTVKREVASAYARYNRALRAKEIYRVGVREQAAANLAVVRQTYDLGSKTLLDYIAEQRRYIDTESGYIDAQLEAYQSRVEILRAVNAPQLTNK